MVIKNSFLLFINFCHLPFVKITIYPIYQCCLCAYGLLWTFFHAFIFDLCRTCQLSNRIAFTLHSIYMHQLSIVRLNFEAVICKLYDFGLKQFSQTFLRFMLIKIWIHDIFMLYVSCLLVYLLAIKISQWAH